MARKNTKKLSRNYKNLRNKRTKNSRKKIIRGNKAKGKTKSKKRKAKGNNMKFTDVPISDKVSMGTLASQGHGDFHYQAYSNYYHFWDLMINENENFNKLICWPFKDKEDWSNFFIKVKLEDDSKLQTTEVVKKNVEPVGYNKEWNNITKTIKNCETTGKRFFMIPIMLYHPIMEGTHANIILVDTKEKIISL